MTTIILDDHVATDFVSPDGLRNAAERLDAATARTVTLSPTPKRRSKRDGF